MTMGTIRSAKGWNLLMRRMIRNTTNVHIAYQLGQDLASGNSFLKDKMVTRPKVRVNDCEGSKSPIGPKQPSFPLLKHTS